MSTLHVPIQDLCRCCGTGPFLQSYAMLSHLGLPFRSSQSMRSVDRTLGLLDFLKSERLAIRVKTPV